MPDEELKTFRETFHVNRNKKIDWNDFELLFEKIKDLRGEDSREYKIVSDAMRTVWRGLMHAAKGVDMYSTANVDLELHLSVDDWNAMWEKYNPKHMDIWQWEYLKYMFFLVDTSGDKFIDKEEYSSVMTIYGVPKKDGEKAFEKFAVDDKGKPIDRVDYGQFVKLWNEYFTSKDKNAPGSYLFGPW